MNVCTNRSSGTLELIYKRTVSLDRFAEFGDLCRKLKGIYFVEKKQLLPYRQELFLFWWTITSQKQSFYFTVFFLQLT